MVGNISQRVIQSTLAKRIEEMDEGGKKGKSKNCG